MTREEAIKICTREKDCVQGALDACADGGHYVSPDGIITALDYVDALDMAISALREQEERSKGCEYCRGVESIYQHTNTTKISIKGQLGKKTLIVESKPCPPYADCCMKDVPDRSAFVIRFCPECGRRLEV